jgi:hypothetical protein
MVVPGLCKDSSRRQSMSLRLKPLDAIQANSTTLRRQSRTRLGRITAHFDSAEVKPVFDHEELMQYSLTVATNIWRKEEAPRHTIDRRALRTLAHELYGQAIGEILEAIHALYEEGLEDDHPAVLRLQRLIKAMQGEDTRHMEIGDLDKYNQTHR